MSNDPRDGKYGRLDKAEAEAQRPQVAAAAQRVLERVILLRCGEQLFRLNKHRVVLGTVVSADVRLVGEDVSPIHAVLEMEPDGAVIYDLASEAGLFVNGQKIVTARLQDGDQITLGSHTLSFSIGEIGKLLPNERPRQAGNQKLLLNPQEDLAPLLLESEVEAQEIFDYRPTQKRALEVVMSWRGNILAVEHFVGQNKVTIGVTRDCDFGVPPFLNDRIHALATRSGEDYVLNLDARMKGVMQRQGQLENLEQLRAGRAGPVQVNLGNEDFAKVSLGEVDFYLSFTAAPPRLKASKLLERDPFLFKMLSASMLLTAVTVNLLLNARVPQTLEAEQIPERIATILYQPEKYVQKITYNKDVSKPVEKKVAEVKPPEPVQPKKPEPVPTQTVKLEIKPNPESIKKPVPKEMVVQAPKAKANTHSTKNQHKAQQGQNQAKEGMGARAKGNEGARGQKNAAPGKTHQDKAMRPSPQGGMGAGGGKSQVQNIGNVDMLNSATAKITNILGDTAEKLGKGGEKLKGFGGFTTQGSGGLALSGQGKGGGGTAEGLGGLADKGNGGGKIGTGKGAAGTGSGIIGGQARVAIKSGGPEEAVVMGTIDADAVEAALLAHRDEFRLCYEKEINAENPGLSGRVSTSFVIGSTGRVNQAGVESTTLKNANTERCILNVIRRIDFPIPRGAGLVQVTYPFKFSPNK